MASRTVTVQDPRVCVIKKNHVSLWSQVQDLYRRGSAAAAEEIIRLAAEAEDERVRSVYANWVIERAWGKPREFDPEAEAGKQKPRFDPSFYTMAEHRQLYDAMTLMARRQGLLPPEEGEDVAG
jgi:hypothetical protein